MGPMPTNRNPHPRGPYVIVSGGAGAGKISIINVVAQWVQKEGEQPCVVKTAFTGCAASNIEEYTLHGSCHEEPCACNCL